MPLSSNAITTLVDNADISISDQATAWYVDAFVFMLYSHEVILTFYPGTGLSQASSPSRPLRF